MLYAFYSADHDAKFGHVIYRTRDGSEVIATYVTKRPEHVGPLYRWPDARFVGRVTRYLGGTSDARKPHMRQVVERNFDAEQCCPDLKLIASIIGDYTLPDGRVITAPERHEFKPRLVPVRLAAGHADGLARVLRRDRRAIPALDADGWTIARVA